MGNLDPTEQCSLETESLGKTTKHYALCVSTGGKLVRAMKARCRSGAIHWWWRQLCWSLPISEDIVTINVVNKDDWTTEQECAHHSETSWIDDIWRLETYILGHGGYLTLTGWWWVVQNYIQETRVLCLHDVLVIDLFVPIHRRPVDRWAQFLLLYAYSSFNDHSSKQVNRQIDFFNPGQFTE